MMEQHQHIQNGTQTGSRARSPAPPRTSAPATAAGGDGANPAAAPGVGRNALAVIQALLALMGKAITARWQRDHRVVTVSYFALVLSTRLFLRSSHAASVPWLAVMVVEDSLSLLSFAIAVLYLHHSQGASLAALAKRVTMSPLRSTRAPQADAQPPRDRAAGSTSMNVAPTRLEPEDVRFVLFAI